MTVLPGRKVAIFEHAKNYAASREEAQPCPFLSQEDETYLRFLVPESARVLEIGCGTGDTLAALKPCHGVGVVSAPR